jgi:hypothetical protein
VAGSATRSSASSTAWRPPSTSAEAKKAQLEARLADPANFTSAQKAAALSAELETATHEVERLYARWQALTA